MMKFLLTTAAVIGFGGAACAETFMIPGDAPVASVTYPDSWDAEAIATGAMGTSPDGKVAFYLEQADNADIEASAKEAIQFLQEQGVTVDGATMRQSEETLNGVPGTYIHWDGKDGEGPVLVGLYGFQISPDVTLIATNWFSRGEGDEEALNTVQNIVNSIKPAGK